MYILGGKSKACPSNKLKFPSSPHPLFQSEAKCKAIDMKMILYSHANKTHFPRKVLQLACFERESFWNTEMSHCIHVLETRNGVVNNTIHGNAFLLGSVGREVLEIFTSILRHLQTGRHY